ncbi:hypothetical protein QYM36_007779 [Artemia franciscana]|uniref:Uncharacterized protein n=1 Tax=Artemia franciscana TaxID=6661 RepID=A0AA88IF90_ARTSF|nr:hypothetical protein QYM36_007779 [Artemia franciscana]
MELLIGAVFQFRLGSTFAPQVPIFTRYQQNWMFVDQSRFERGMSSDAVSTSVQDIEDSTTEFAKGYLRENQPRDDYREFLELVIIFLDSVLERGIRFIAPGATHHARWLSKVIYSLKIWMFRGQFHLSKKEEKGLQDVCIFAARVYLRLWMRAPKPASAQYHDDQLLISLLNNLAINSEIFRVTSMKMANHL